MTHIVSSWWCAPDSANTRPQQSVCIYVTPAPQPHSATVLGVLLLITSSDVHPRHAQLHQQILEALIKPLYWNTASPTSIVSKHPSELQGRATQNVPTPLSIQAFPPAEANAWLRKRMAYNNIPDTEPSQIQHHRTIPSQLWQLPFHHKIELHTHNATHKEAPTTKQKAAMNLSAQCWYHPSTRQNCSYQMPGWTCTYNLACHSHTKPASKTCTVDTICFSSNTKKRKRSRAESLQHFPLTQNLYHVCV